MLPRLIIVMLIIGAAIIWFVQRNPTYNTFIDSLVPNLIAAAVVILSVDLVIELRDRRRERTIRLIGYRKIESSLRSLLELWRRLIIGSLAAPPTDEDLFSAINLKEFASNFNLNSQSDFFRPTNWGHRLNWLLNEEKKKITGYLDLYGSFFPPDLIVRLDKLMDHSFPRIFEYYPNIEEFSQKTTGKKPTLKLNEEQIQRYLLDLFEVNLFLSRAIGRELFSTNYKAEYGSMLTKYRRRA